jgi:hypothetical protein
MILRPGAVFSIEAEGLGAGECKNGTLDDFQGMIAI